MQQILQFGCGLRLGVELLPVAAALGVGSAAFSPFARESSTYTHVARTTTKNIPQPYVYALVGSKACSTFQFGVLRISIFEGWKSWVRVPML